jgi:hypothetical protein
VSFGLDRLTGGSASCWSFMEETRRTAPVPTVALLWRDILSPGW